MLSDTKDGLVRSSCHESLRTVPSFEFALQSIKSMKGTNQRRDMQHGGTLDFTYIEGYDILRDNAVRERHYVAIQQCHRFTN